MRREMVSTNCPTAALKPERKALNGCKRGMLVKARKVRKRKEVINTYVVAADDAVDELNCAIQGDVEEEDVEEEGS